MSQSPEQIAKEYVLKELSLVWGPIAEWSPERLKLFDGIQVGINTFVRDCWPKELGNVNPPKSIDHRQVRCLKCGATFRWGVKR